MVSAGDLPPIRLSDLLWLALALFVIVGTGLGIRDPWPADEPRFAALARDMALSHEWLFPRVGGDLYQDKPPLFFWLLAICFKIFGSVKASFLVPSFLAAGGILFLIYDFGRRSVSREAGLAAALITVCTLQFLMVTRGAQIDATLCFLTTFSLYALLRHCLLGPAWRWYFIGGFAAGVGIFTKGVGFLPVLVLIPYFALRAARWQGLADINAGKGGWRWWLAPLAMLLAVSLWFVPMLIAVATSGSPEYAAYRDEILFKQTVSRYAAAWHHVKPWYYFIVEVIPALWLPWSLLLIWLVPRFKAAFHERNARVWLPIFWLLIVLLFFSVSPGKRGVYLLPALPALALAALPFLESLLSRVGVKRAGFVLAGLFFIAGAVFAIGLGVHAKFAVKAVEAASLGGATAFYVYLALCGAGTRVRLRACSARGMARGAGLPGHRVLVFHRSRDERRAIGLGFRPRDAGAGEIRRAAGARQLQGTVSAVSRSTDGELRSSALAGRSAGVTRRGGMAECKTRSRVTGAGTDTEAVPVFRRESDECRTQFGRRLVPRAPSSGAELRRERRCSACDLLRRQRSLRFNTVQILSIRSPFLRYSMHLACVPKNL